MKKESFLFKNWIHIIVYLMVFGFFAIIISALNVKYF